MKDPIKWRQELLVKRELCEVSIGAQGNVLGGFTDRIHVLQDCVKAWLKCSLLTLEGHGLSQGLLRSRAHDGADEQLIKQVMMTARVCSVGAADGAGRNKSYL
ncbi:uncharacterized protein [Triticum aestivum]|uniref:uncharacterized protein n=1 Tax=Triticum aestivum TaxID=4565 RepID=UPI001D02BF24|nr:uncharacterized protein LOC123068244 [Triticum aestivum]